MAANFPDAPTVGQIFTPVRGLNYRWNGEVWEGVSTAVTALPYNYLVNPCFQITQEAQANAVGSGKYPLDQHAFYSSQNVLAYQAPFVSVNNSQFKLVCANQASVASIAATDWCHTPIHYLEGRRTAGFKWGTAQAEQAILRFWLRTKYAGTFAVGIRNIDVDRAYTMTIVSPANVETKHEFVIPGCTDGNWYTDHRCGMNIVWTWFAGTNYQTAPGVWTAGNLHAVPGMTNGLLNADAYWELSDIGLYLDPFKTGVAPPWEAPLETQVWLDCLRYWYPCRNLRGISTGTSMARGRALHPTPMRTTPTAVIGTGPNPQPLYCWDSLYMHVASSLGNYSNTTVAEFDIGTGGTFGVTGVSNQLLSEYPGYLEMSARM